MTDIASPPPSRVAIAIPLAVLAGLVLIGAFFINVYVEQERQRDLQQWEARLGLVADAKSRAIGKLLGQSFDDLQELADNASLQLYLGQLLRPGAGASGETEAASLSYLRNLVLASADRFGYWSIDTPRVNANLALTGATGMAVLDLEFNPVVATPGMPPLGEPVHATLRRALTGIGRQASGLVPDGRDRAVVVFAVPVRAIMGSRSGDEDEPIGLLVGIKDAARELFPIVAGGAGFAEDSEAILLEMRDDRVVYLSSTKDGVRPMQRSMPAGRTRLAAAHAVRTLGGFGILDNYAGRPVLQVSRRIPRQTWILAQQVDAGQALSESNQRRQFLLTSLSLLLLTIVTIAVAAWRHGSSVRARQQAAELRDKAMKLQRQTELLHAVSDNIDVLTILVSGAGKIVFTNRSTAEALGSRIADLVGNDLGAALGAATAAELEGGVRQARKTRDRAHRVMSLRLGANDGIYHASFIPVARIGQHENPLLLVLSDITQLQRAQRRHESLLRKLVSTLVHIVDLHDPYYAFHSARIAEVSVAVGREMGLNRRDLETLELAAMLSHVGKITIPREVLVKAEPLTGEEQDLLRGHVEIGLNLLKNLDFEGPVLEVMAQKQERLDGSGYPSGLTGEQMTLPGKILSAANAFVALVSPRAFRDAMPVGDAIDRLMQDADRLYDRPVLAALFHIAENLRESWSEWNRADPPDTDD
ncbi:MAG: HD-GYP domain-containing protein [Gammaproteobacteria bacterium]